jgi:hypothetical protein
MYVLILLTYLHARDMHGHVLYAPSMPAGAWSSLFTYNLMRFLDYDQWRSLTHSQGGAKLTIHIAQLVLLARDR